MSNPDAEPIKQDVPDIAGHEDALDDASSIRRYPDEREERGYFCRHCGRIKHGFYLPSGWYIVQRATGHGNKHHRLGLYCNSRCLMSSHSRLQRGHEQHAARLRLPTDEIDEPALILEEALHLMHDKNLSIRQAGDLLDVPTSVLRAWLSAGGISISSNHPSQSQSQSSSPHQAQDAATTFHLSKEAKRDPLVTLNELKQKKLITTSHAPTPAADHLTSQPLRQLSKPPEQTTVSLSV
ncbi:hypothetical protein E1264_33115 [Actinomadura sp. KC216]|uniref:hypothetical protein n=1 Tax=Actinomadura sp. KC216 TaxID=2530370 RepID=UPI00105028CB|nr:hypothetical protein [Actinomadura sp. KC216]TDB81151.1 hypothetical protein E1264_33115 [Actinomadura sp. KC216]